MHPLLKKILIFLPFPALLLIWACSVEQTEGDEYVRIELSETLKDYHRILITLVSPVDTNMVYDTVWNAAIPDPTNFPRFKLKVSKGKDFTILIRAYNTDGAVIWAKNIAIVGDVAQQAVIVKSDLRLFRLSLSKGSLEPTFSPLVHTYRAKVADSIDNIVIAARMIDSTNEFSLNGSLILPGQPIPPQALKKGVNTFSLLIKSGSASQLYTVAITRDGGVIDTSIFVTSLTAALDSLSIYEGEAGKDLVATTVPSDVPLYWSSQNDGIAKVDESGNIIGVGSGTTVIVVRAGKLSDFIRITVVKDTPVLSVGENIAVKPNSEVAFDIKVSQKNGTIASFKFDLEGDGVWDNADSLSGTYSASLKHTYTSATPKTFLARFYVRDSEGNEVEATRGITVSNAEYLIAIISPSKDTLINKSPITIRYAVNGTVMARIFPLIEGKNPLSVDTGSGANKVTATVNVTLDTTPPKVSITSPKNNTYTNQNDIEVIWDVDGIRQMVQASEDLGTMDGVKSIFRQYTDAAGNTGSDSLRVFKDTQSPTAPKITGTSPTNMAPKWNWTSGGNGGFGEFRFKLGDANFVANYPTTKDSSYTLPSTAVSNSIHILYVQERDAAGNWSLAANMGVLYDATKPTVAIDSPQVSGTYFTALAGVKLRGSATGPNAIAKVSYQVDGGTVTDADFAAGKWSIANISLMEGKISNLVVTTTDIANNTADATLLLQRDNTAPGVPVIGVSPPAKTNVTLATWTWSAGSDGNNGSGLNGNYRYNLNGGAWSGTTQENIVKDLTLSDTGSGLNIFYLQQQDNAGNWSASASRTVRLDTEGPSITLTNPNASTSYLTSSKIIVTATVSDPGCPVASVSITGQTSGGTQMTAFGTTWTSTNLGLAQGANSLAIIAVDSLGNNRKLTAVINVAVAKPTVLITNPFNDNTLTNLDSIIVSYTVNGVARIQNFPLSSDGVNSLTVNSLPGDNELGLIGSDTVKVTRDATRPNAPLVTAVEDVTNGSPSITWTSKGDAAGGSGIHTPARYRFQYFNKGIYSAFVQGTGNTISVSGLSDGTYTFYVQEQDKAQNWSPNSSGVVVLVDTEAPTLTIDGPVDAGRVTSEDPHVFGKVTDANGIDSVYYVLNPGNKKGTAVLSGNSWSLDLTDYKDDATNTLAITAKDKAGNHSKSQTIEITKRSNVVFVSSSKGGDGKSWQTAYANLDQAVSDPRVKAGNAQIWVAAGSYSAANWVELPKNGALIGGFSPTIYSKDTSSRDLILNKSIISGVMLTINSDGALILVDGITFEQSTFNRRFGNGLTKNLHFNRCNFRNFNIGYVVSDPDNIGISLSFSYCFFSESRAPIGDVQITGTMAFNYCTFTGNDKTFPQVNASRNSDLILSHTTFTDVHLPGNYIIESYADHTLIDHCSIPGAFDDVVNVDKANLTLIPGTP